MNNLIEILFIGLIGWIAGVIVNYVSDVLPQKRKLVHPFCNYCFSPFSLTNYIFWPRKCTSCRLKRPGRVLVVEFIYIVTTIWLWQSPPEISGFWLGLLLIVYFGIIIVIDLEHRLILHPTSLFGVIIGTYFGITTNGILDTIIGGIVGFGIMWLMYQFGAFFLAWISKRRGHETDEVALGFGDVNLSGVIGLMLGWPAIIMGLLLGILIGGIISLIYIVILLILRRYQLFTALPYGPYLITGAVLIIFFRDAIVRILGG